MLNNTTQLMCHPSSHSPSLHKQRGVVLFTALMFMVVLTLIALVASQSTVLESRMSNNTIVKARAGESSEALRMGAHDMFDAHLYNRGWPLNSGGAIANDLFDIPPGVTLNNVDDWGTANGNTEDFFDADTWTLDMALQVDGNTDGDYTDGEDQNASLTVFKTVTTNATGSATAMVAGYEGLGKASASGGALNFFELRSTGRSAGSASTVTSSNFRYVVRN